MQPGGLTPAGKWTFHTIDTMLGSHTGRRLAAPGLAEYKSLGDGGEQWLSLPSLVFIGYFPVFSFFPYSFILLVV